MQCRHRWVGSSARRTRFPRARPTCIPGNPGTQVPTQQAGEWWSRSSVAPWWSSKGPEGRYLGSLGTRPGRRGPQLPSRRRPVIKLRDPDVHVVQRRHAERWAQDQRYTTIVGNIEEKKG